MNQLLVSKSCSLKNTQKVFYLQINQAASCCRAYSEPLDISRPLSSYVDQWQEESRQLDNGVELDGCNHCWQSERQNKLSYRQQASKTHANQIELYLSNLCNHMCSYCSPKYSSEWQASIATQGQFQQISASAKDNLKITNIVDNTQHWLEEISNYINQQEDDSLIIKLLGGEPLMQQRNLEKLLSLNLKKINKLIINTNLNPPTDKFLKWVLAHIPREKLSFAISIDTDVDYNHIPRAGFDKNRFINNLNLLIDNQIEFKFLAVVSVLGIFGIEKFLSWIDQNSYNIDFYKIDNPECLDPVYIPFRIRKQIWNSISHLTVPYIIKEVLLTDNQLVDLKLFEQYNYLNQYFDRTNIDPLLTGNTIFTEYWVWLCNSYGTK